MDLLFLVLLRWPLSWRTLSTVAGRDGGKQEQQMNRVKTGILMLNMGGPASEAEVQPFLTRLFTDTDIMRLPFNRRYILLGGYAP